MHLQTHILGGWCAANALGLTPRQRLAALVVSVAPDLDGLSVLFGQNAYFDWHHKLTHNAWFGLVLAAALAIGSGNRLRMAGAALVLFALHLGMDWLGSGPGWDIYWLWPVSPALLRNPWAWEFHSWQNLSIAAGTLVGTVLIARYAGRTPLECLMPSLDRQLVAVAGRKLRTEEDEL